MATDADSTDRTHENGRRRVVILGAGGRDFHVFNTCYRGRGDVRVVAFTAEQIPNIDDRTYPADLAGPGYPEGIPIKPESELEKLLRAERIDEAVFAYSDVSHDYVAGRRRLVEGAGARFSTFDVPGTMLRADVPVVAVCAVRTGCGKSQTTRAVVKHLKAKGKRVVVLRHPMPYGNLRKQRVQRFATIEDLARHECTIEEMEEYEPHIRAGTVVFAGVDYAAILAEAEKEADVVLWDGGNNDTPFFKPKLHVTVVDPLRAGHEVSYFPGLDNFRLADVIVMGKMSEATDEAIRTIESNLRDHNPDALVVRARSRIEAADPAAIRGRKVLVVEDGPSVTHGGTRSGAGKVAALAAGAGSLIDPRPFAVGSIADTFAKYPEIDVVLPAMGYSQAQIQELEETIRRSPAEVVVIGTPIDLTRILKIDVPAIRVTYEYEDVGEPRLATILDKAL